MRLNHEGIVPDLRSRIRQELRVNPVWKRDPLAGFALRINEVEDREVDALLAQEDENQRIVQDLQRLRQGGPQPNPNPMPAPDGDENPDVPMNGPHIPPPPQAPQQDPLAPLPPLLGVPAQQPQHAPQPPALPEPQAPPPAVPGLPALQAAGGGLQHAQVDPAGQVPLNPWGQLGWGYLVNPGLGQQIAPQHALPIQPGIPLDGHANPPAPEQGQPQQLPPQDGVAQAQALQLGNWNGECISNFTNLGSEIGVMHHMALLEPPIRFANPA